MRCVLRKHSLSENVTALLWEGQLPAVANGTTVSGKSPIFIKYAWYLWHFANCISSLDNRLSAGNSTWKLSVLPRWALFSTYPQWNKDQITFHFLFSFAFLIACALSPAHFFETNVLFSFQAGGERLLLNQNNYDCRASMCANQQTAFRNILPCAINSGVPAAAASKCTLCLRYRTFCRVCKSEVKPSFSYHVWTKATGFVVFFSCCVCFCDSALRV